MNDMNQDQGKSVKNLYLETIIALKQNKLDIAYKLVGNTLSQHINHSRNISNDIKFYIHFSPDFLIQLVEVYLALNIEAA